MKDREDKNWEYDIKCRGCGKITRMHHSTHRQVSSKSFKLWVAEHSTTPIQKQCSCDNGMILIHDLIGIGNVLFL